MKKVAILAVFLGGCVSTGPKIIMTNAAGQQVSCGSLQAAAVNTGEYVAMAALANNQVKSCVEKYQASGYGVVTPSRRIPAVGYAAIGPLHDGGYTGPIKAVIVAQGAKGQFLFARPDGVSCEGSFVTMQGGASGLMVKYGDLIGLTYNTSGMVPGIALGSCSNGASFQAEYYAVAGTDNGFGVATDSNGNVYKIISQ